jgi:hypothetical protein
LRGIDANDSEGLQAFIDREVAEGAVRLDWDPAAILERMKSPGLAAIVKSPRLIGPWLWNTGNALLVYGLMFDHP